MDNIKQILSKKIIDRNGFWSFHLQPNTEISDEVLIVKTLTYLDIDDINLLFQMYSTKKIKQVWLEQMAIQGEYYARLNKLIAWMYFGIKKPETYLKKVENKYLKSFQ